MTTVPQSCILCGDTPLLPLDEQAARCGSCGLLLHLAARPLGYTDGGGQAAPDANKTYWRLENARMRFAIIVPHLSGHEVFVDVGCGSGEMIEAGRQFFPHVFGFDTNQPLIRHIRETFGLTVFESHFDATLIPPALSAGKKVFALSHVLEHLARPLQLVRQIHAAMNSGDLLYIEVPLHTGASFREQGYAWTLWNDEHLALYSMQALDFIAGHLGLEVLHRGTRIFARGSRSGKTRLRLFLRAPLRFLRVALSKPACHSMADLMIADYGCMVLRKP